jgi:capsular polysaccharide biosynthesis protein
VSDGPIDSYLRELERVLRARKLEAERIVEEAREHLADAVEDGIRRGLTRTDAERDAVNRFGTLDVIAAHAAPARHPVVARVTAVLDRVLLRWRWISAATATAALLTSVVQSYVLPTRYRSESVIAIVSHPVPEFAMAVADADGSAARLQSALQSVLSRERLEQTANDFGLPTGQQMRRDIGVEIVPTTGPGDIRQFKVSFQSPDARLSQRVTERIASMFIIENLRDRQLWVQQHEAGFGSQTSRMFGDQFRIVQAPGLPSRPAGPNRIAVSVLGALAGLTFSVVLAGRRGSTEAV